MIVVTKWHYQDTPGCLSHLQFNLSRPNWQILLIDNWQWGAFFFLFSLQCVVPLNQSFMIVTEEHEEQVTGSFCGFTMSSTKMTPLSPARAMSSINTVLMQCKERQQFPRSGSLHLCRTTFSYYILNSLRVPNETKKVNGVAFSSLCLHNLLSFRMLFLYSYPLHCCHSGFIQFSLSFNQVHSSLEIFIFIPR